MSDETKEFLLPGGGQALALSENDLPGPESPLPLPSSEITYSEPTLPETETESISSKSSSRNPSGSGGEDRQEPSGLGVQKRKTSGEKGKLRFAPTPPNSFHNLPKQGGQKSAEGRMDELTVPEDEMDKMTSSLEKDRRLDGAGQAPTTAGQVHHALRPPVPQVTRSGEHTESFTERDHHATMQNMYRKTRRRHFTDPVDFEGILNIIGGCGWWQTWVYLLISLQQIPHAMFNLSVVYMMFQPDHWCKVPGLDLAHQKQAPKVEQVDHHHPQWNISALLNTEVALPQVFNRQRGSIFHSQCLYFDRGYDMYQDLIHMPLANASSFVESSNVTVPQRKCDDWDFDESVMTETIVTQWKLVCDDNIHRADAQLAYSLGFLVGCLISGLSSDRFGRKPTIIGFGVLASMFGIILPYSNYFYMFLLVRFLSAVCNEAADLAAYVLCMEITGTKYRAMVGSFLQAPWAIGYALLAVVAYLTKSWKSMQIVTAALHTVTILLICVLPESPRWLIVNNRVREAERIIRKACRMNKCNLPADLELVKHAEQRRWVKRNQRAHLGHLLKSRELLMRTGIVFLIWAATALVYYGLVIALSDQSGPGRALFSGNFFVNNAVAGAIELPTLLGCVFLLRFGRKKSQMGTLVGAGLMIIAAMACHNHAASGFTLVFMMLAKVCIQGAFNILYIFTSELYPTVIRNSAVGTCSMVARLGAGVSSYVAILSDLTLPIVPLIIFGVFTLVAATMVLFLPETRDQPLPDTLQDAVTFLKPETHYSCVIGGSSEPETPRGEGRAPAPVLPPKLPPVHVSECEEEEETPSLLNLADLDIPSHPDKLPEAC